MDIWQWMVILLAALLAFSYMYPDKFHSYTQVGVDKVKSIIPFNFGQPSKDTSLPLECPPGSDPVCATATHITYVNACEAAKLNISYTPGACQ